METRKKFRLDMPVRWNSTYFLLDHALYYKDVFIYLSERDSAVKSLVPSGDDWVKVAYVHKFLKVFYDVTNLFSASRHPTSNSYVHGVWKIQSALKDIENGPGYFLTDTVARMQAKFNKYWSDYNTVLCCATLLDPRYKVTFLKYCFVKNYGQEGATSRVDKVTDTLKLWFKEYNKLSDFQGDVLNTGCNLSTSNESELDD
ncbi:unnamed protein product [Cuscuta campestris]|uniref:hAT-like transposase RNase-H fold domain-containing protein n=1 Tax=Cuscuta campestris TaxID=132261 RepID=A0A484LBB4_9ASTE|nr:unnamed protein product [Cuscuta campestris]